MDVDSIFQAEGMIISVAYFMGVGSYKWNSITNRLERSTRVLDRVKRYCVIGIMTFLKLAIISSVISQRAIISINSFGGTILMLGTLLCGLSLACELHMVIKEHQIPAFANSFRVFLVNLQETYGRRDVRKKVPPTTYILIVLFWNLMVCSFFLGVLPILSIKCNFLFPMLRGFLSRDPGLLFRIALTIPHFVGYFYLVSSFLVNTVLAVPFATVLPTLSLELGKSATRTYTTLEFQEPRNIITLARASLIFLNQLEECILNSFYPVIVAGLEAVVVIALAVLISVQLPILALLTLIICLVLWIIFLYSIVIWPVEALNVINNFLTNLDVTEATLLKVDMKNLEASAIGKLEKEVKYLKKLKRSVRPFHVKIGMFAKLEKDIPQAVLDIIISKTVDLLLLIQ